MSKVFLLYESHADKNTVAILTKLFSVIRSANIKAFGVENPEGQAPFFNPEELKTNFDRSLHVLNAWKKESDNPDQYPHIISVLEKCGLQINLTSMPTSSLPELFKKAFDIAIKNLETEYQSNMLLSLTNIHYKLDAFSFDLPESNKMSVQVKSEESMMLKRDEFMSDSIARKALSLSDGESVIVLVGASHHPVADLVSEKTGLEVVQIHLNDREYDLTDPRILSLSKKVDEGICAMIDTRNSSVIDAAIEMAQKLIVDSSSVDAKDVTSLFALDEDSAAYATGASASAAASSEPYSSLTGDASAHAASEME